jgi:hypothetical protein
MVIGAIWFAMLKRKSRETLRLIPTIWKIEFQTFDDEKGAERPPFLCSRVPPTARIASKQDC